jgi:starch phosphorylase
MYGKTIRECSNEQVYTALLALVKKVTEERKEAQERQEKENGKKVYYISAEFLIGKLLSNNLINLGLYEQISQELEENGKNIAQIEEAEPEPEEPEKEEDGMEEDESQEDDGQMKLF